MDVSNYLWKCSSRSWMGLVMTLVEDRCLCIWLLCYVKNLGDSRMELPRYRSSPTALDHFHLGLFSSSEVLGQNASIRNRLPTAACWSRQEKRGRCEANLLYVESDFGTTDKSFTVFFARWGVKFDHWVKISARALSYLWRRGGRKPCNHIVLWILISCLMRKIVFLF